MRTLRRIAILASLPLTACGGPSQGTPASMQLRLGKRAFATHCTACHSLAGVGPKHPEGDDLTGYRMSPAQVLSLARSMPPAAKMSDRELRAVAKYVASEQARARRH